MPNDDDDRSAWLRLDAMRLQTVVKLLSFATVPLVYGRYDGDDGDESVSSEGTDDYGDENSE